MLIPQAIVQQSGGGSFTKIADQLLGSDTATFDFTSIPSSYIHLQLIYSARMTGAVTDDVVTMQINGDGGGNYTWQYAAGSGTSNIAGGVSSGTSARVGEIPGSSTGAGAIGSFEMSFHNYAATTLIKSWESHGGRLGSGRFAAVFWGQWNSTSAISQITLTPASGNFLAGSRATLYGLS